MSGRMLRIAWSCLLAAAASAAASPAEVQRAIQAEAAVLARRAQALVDCLAGNRLDDPALAALAAELPLVAEGADPQPSMRRLAALLSAEGPGEASARMRDAIVARLAGLARPLGGAAVATMGPARLLEAQERLRQDTAALAEATLGRAPEELDAAERAALAALVRRQEALAAAIPPAAGQAAARAAAVALTVNRLAEAGTSQEQVASSLRMLAGSGASAVAGGSGRPAAGGGHQGVAAAALASADGLAWQPSLGPAERVQLGRLRGAEAPPGYERAVAEYYRALAGPLP